MSFSNFTRRIAVGVALAAGLGSAALAQDAVTTADVNMRSGPGTAYPVIMGLPEGAGVDYIGAGCGGSWCNIAYDGARGWVSAAYLDDAGPRRPPIVVRPAPPIVIAPPVYGGPVYGERPYYGDRPYYGGRPSYRPRPDWDRPDGGYRPRPPGGGWDRPRPPSGGWERPDRPDRPRPPVAQPQPPSGGGGTMVPLQPRGGPMIGPPGGIPRGGTGPCANVPVGVPCG